jgi:hypothetical protein
MTTSVGTVASDGCTTHRDRCNFGHAHTWNLGGFFETDEHGHLVRIGHGEYRSDIFWCDRCDQLCYAGE